MPYKVLYLYAGKKRRSDMHAKALALVKKLSRQRKMYIQLEFEEIDMVRVGEDHNLLNPDMQEEILEKIREGYYDLIFVTPPCNTWSRAVFIDHKGPRPLRDRAHPMGRPRLRGWQRHKLEAGNAHVLFSLKVMRAARQRVPPHLDAAALWYKAPEIKMFQS